VSSALKYANGFEALEAEEHVDHPNVAKHELLLTRKAINAMRVGLRVVFNRVDLTDKGHHALALPA
jgi:hypothetical protein